MKQYYDSTYSILKDINIALGGVDKDFDSNYSILLSILDVIGGGSKEEIIVDLPATIDLINMALEIEATVTDNGVLDIDAEIEI